MIILRSSLLGSLAIAKQLVAARGPHFEIDAREASTNASHEAAKLWQSELGTTGAGRNKHSIRLMAP